jgi:hypothetical protein
LRTLDTTTLPKPQESPSATQAVPYGVNELRLTARQWVVTLLIVLPVLLLTPWVWGRSQRFDTGPDYRLPYQLSNDYWLYSQRASQVIHQDKVLLLGDSMVWGEYVAADGTLPHFLNGQTGVSDRFVNLGLDGLFPLAQEGLIKYYGQSLQHEKILVHFNPLWLTSPKADLSAEKEVPFNHAGLVPQFSPTIPCYRATAEDRLRVMVRRNVPFLQWVGHIEDAYFDQKSIPKWTLADDGGSPPTYPNSYRNPLTQISPTVPPAPADDPDRGLKSPRHKRWSAEGSSQTRFEWVSLGTSLQWRAFQRQIKELRRRGNSVFVVVGPFNEHMIVEENRPTYRKLQNEMAVWLTQNQIPHALPDVLPSELYADASHPLTEGYHLLAQRLYTDPEFQKWIK